MEFLFKNLKLLETYSLYKLVNLKFTKTDDVSFKKILGVL